MLSILRRKEKMAKILIIDDEEPIRKMLRMLFEKNGFEVFDACNSHHGITVFKEHDPDLVVTDLIMPEKEGLETIREIKKLNPDTKIITISGGGVVHPEMYLDLAGKLGADHSFAKPVDTEELVSAIKKLLAEKSLKLQ